MTLFTRLNLIAAVTLGLSGAGPRGLPAPDACAGPGAAFGVASYHCGGCTIQQVNGARPLSRFHTEPVVLETIRGSALRVGDIIVAVNGQPITTDAGAEAFTYPSRGEATLVVRRDGRETSLVVQVPDDCSRRSDHGRFGFAIACSSCTRRVGPDGIGHWTFTTRPSVGDLDPDGPAAASGLRVGDVIEMVDGHPVEDSTGALALAKADGAASLTLTVRHAGGERLTVTLRPRNGKH